MNSLVLELQELAQDSTSNIKDLLMKSLIVAKKLKIKDFERFINLELKGYKNAQDLPEYRKTEGILRANTGFGIVPVLLDPAWEKTITTRYLVEPIANYQDLLESDEDFFSSNFNAEQKRILNELLDGEYDYFLEISKTSISNVLNNVRVLILEWSIKLEDDGILGEGMRFTKEEKVIANKNSYTVNNFYGDVTNSQIQQHSTSSQIFSNNEIKELEEFISNVREQLDKTQLNKEQIIKINETLSNIEKELKSNKPNKGIIDKGLNFIKEVCNSVASDLVSMGIVYGITQLLG